MKTVLIVDDESRQVKALASIIRRLRPDYRTLEAGDADTAWDILENEAVDAVLTDIRMPDEDGLTLVERIAGSKPHIKTVLISGYGQFDYAKKAIAHRVIEYIVKPIGLADIEQVITKLENLFVEDNKHKQLTRERFWQEALLGNEYNRQHLKFEEYGAYDGPGLVIVFQLSSTDPGSLLTLLNNRWTTEAVSIGQSEIVADSAGRILTSIVWLNQALAAKPSDLVMKICRLLEKVKSDGGEQITTGVSGMRASLNTALTEAYAEALFALKHRFYAPDETVFWGSDNHPFTDRVSPSAKEVAAPILSAIKAGDSSKALELANSFFKRREAPPYPDPVLVKDEIGMLLWMVLNGMQSMLPADSLEWSQAHLRRKFQDLDDYQALRIRFKKFVQQLLEFSEKTQMDKNGLIIMRCQNYLQQHYMNELSLEAVAEMFHFNASYFSNLFKQRTGVNFSEYVLDLRLKHARQLLADSDEKVAIISERCGFSSPAYFNKMFKREIGVSPKAFRQMHGNGAAE